MKEGKAKKNHKQFFPLELRFCRTSIETPPSPLFLIEKLMEMSITENEMNWTVFKQINFHRNEIGFYHICIALQMWKKKKNKVIDIF